MGMADHFDNLWVSRIQAPASLQHLNRFSRASETGKVKSEADSRRHAPGIQCHGLPIFAFGVGPVPFPELYEAHGDMSLGEFGVQLRHFGCQLAEFIC